jgi:excisionase family DNA binding protein
MSSIRTTGFHHGVVATLGFIRPTLTVKRTATLLGVSPGLIWKMVRTGELESTKVGARRVIYRDSIERMQVAGNR